MDDESVDAYMEGEKHPSEDMQLASVKLLWKLAFSRLLWSRQEQSSKRSDAV